MSTEGINNINRNTLPQIAQTGAAEAVSNPASQAAANPNLLKEMGSSVAFSGAITGFGGLTSAVRYRSPIKALKATDVKDFKKLQATLKSQGKDVFTRGVELSQNYDVYKAAAKKAQKLQNAVKKGDISLMQKFKNLFRKEKLDFSTVQKQAAEASADLAKKKALIASGQDIIEDGAKLMGKSGFGTAKNLFKSELKNKFVLGITVLGALPRIKEEIIPAFKEKGLIGGIKATGKVLARTATDFVSNAGFSAIGRAFGTAVGSIFFPGVGSAVGGMFGDVIGSFFSMKLTEKIFDKNKKDKISADPAGKETIAKEAISKEAIQEVSVLEKEKPTLAGSKLDTTSYVDNTSANTTAKIAQDRLQSSPQNYRNKGYIKPQDGVYKTQWVNELAKQKRQQTARAQLQSQIQEQEQKADFVV